MKHSLTTALKLREQGDLTTSNEILLKLISENPNNPYLNYQVAWSFDILGEETKAVPYYKKAISLGLEGELLESAFIGLGSTYRTIGQYIESKRAFEEGLALFPENEAMRTFYAMTLYNLGEFAQAMELLLTTIATTSDDEKIQAYQRAITFYANNLDKVWK